MEGLFGFLRSYLFGLRGFEVLTTAGTYTRDTGWYLIQCDIDSVYAATQNSDLLNGTADNLGSQTRVQGVQVYGEFKTITVTSGSVLAYPISSKNDTTFA